MLIFKFSHKKHNYERNLQCQLLFPVKISYIYVATAARLTAHPVQKGLLFNIDSFAVMVAEDDSMTLTQIPLYYSMIFFKVGIARPPIFRRIEIPQPIALPAPEESTHQIHRNFRFILKAIATFELGYISNKLGQAQHLPPGDHRKQIRVVPVRQQTALTLTQPHPFALMPKPSHRAAVMHQHDVTCCSDQLSLQSKKMPNGKGRAAQNALACGLPGMKMVGRRDSCGFLCWGAVAVGLASEYIWAQIVASDLPIGCLFNFQTIFSRSHTIGTIQPIPYIRLVDANSFSQCCLAAAKLYCLLKIFFHACMIKQLFYHCQNNCGLFVKNTCFRMRLWH